MAVSASMWWPSTGSLEYCQYGGTALIIKNTFTGNISAVSVVCGSRQGHIQDNLTEEKFWTHCTEIKMAAKHPETRISAVQLYAFRQLLNVQLTSKYVKSGIVYLIIHLWEIGSLLAYELLSL